MIPTGLTACRLARDIDVPASRIQAILTEGRPISSNIALRLARHFGTTREFWLKMQRGFELETAGRNLAVGLMPR
ncbi:MAG: plasmid maintenance system antidote protein [Rhodospirillales bacterium]|nr:plasmid maintenance system antidote protein [Rhodospirillales bacterium]